MRICVILLQLFVYQGLLEHEVEVHCSHSKIFESIPCMYSVACAGFYALAKWMKLVIATPVMSTLTTTLHRTLPFCLVHRQKLGQTLNLSPLKCTNVNMTVLFLF